MCGCWWDMAHVLVQMGLWTWCLGDIAGSIALLTFRQACSSRGASMHLWAPASVQEHCCTMGNHAVCSLQSKHNMGLAGMISIASSSDMLKDGYM